MKPLPALVIFVAGLLVGTVLSWLALRPSSSSASSPARPARDVARTEGTRVVDERTGDTGAVDGTDDGTRDEDPRDDDVEIASAGVVEVPRAEIIDHDAWRKQGFVEMTPPVRLPSDGAERDKIEVWLRIPEGARIEVKQLDDGRRTLRFPPGTIADRVESFAYAKDEAGAWRWSVSDVRGTRIELDGREEFHVFVPAGPEPLSRLIGWEWTRGDELEQRAATSFLVSHLEVARTIQDEGRPQTAEARKRFTEDYRRNNDCARCHAHDKPEQTIRPRGIHRRTDASGFYVPLSVLMDTIPLERHRPRDMNVGDPFLKLSCPTGDPPMLAERGGGARDFRCEGGGSPSATLDVRKGVAAKDPRTLALCRSRAYLRDHMSDAGRALFADAFVACGL